MLAPQSTDRVLEIGCGGGVAVALLCERVTSGSVTAIDRSNTMVRRSRDRNALHIASGRARVEQVGLEDASFGDGAFDRALAVNVNVFWTHPSASLNRLATMLAPGGLLCLVYEPPAASKARELALEMTHVLPEQGFDAPTVAFRDVERGAAVCVTARARGFEPARWQPPA
jgi:protein-L-isoaspartate O-methyltransferase